MITNHPFIIKDVCALPYIDDESLAICKSLCPSAEVASIESIEKEMSTLSDLKRKLASAKQNENFHQILSLVVAIASVALVASTVFFFPPLAIIYSLLGMAICGGSQVSLDSFRTGEGSEIRGIADLAKYLFIAFIVGGLTLGLSQPVQYAIAAFTRKNTLQAKVTALEEKVSPKAIKVFNYVKTNSAELTKKLNAEIEKTEDKSDKIRFGVVLKEIEIAQQFEFQPA